MKIIALISISVLPFEQWKSGYKNVRDNQMPWAPGLIFSTLNIVQNANWAFLVCSRPLRCRTLVNISFGMMNNWNVKGEYRVKKSYSKDDKIRRTCHHLPLGTVSSGDFISGIPGLQSACFDFCTLPFLVLGVAAGFVEVWPLDEKGRVVDLKMGFWTTRNMNAILYVEEEWIVLWGRFHGKLQPPPRPSYTQSALWVYQ